MIKANGKTANQALYRSAVTGPRWIVPRALVLQQLGYIPNAARMGAKLDQRRRNPSVRTRNFI
jgi:hypothetical protein